MAEKNPISSYDIVKYPLTTEKSINMIARNNSLSFVVDKRSKSPEIKKAIEELYKVKVARINTSNTVDGRKVAYVRFSPENPALDIATKLGIL